MPDSARRDDWLIARDLVVDFPQRHGPPVRALTLPHFAAEPGAAWGVRGPSGCGKTTLLHVLAGLLPPTSGTVHWGDSEISALAEPMRDRWRRDTIGVVFQDFHLVPELDALENVLLPDRFRHLRTSHATRHAALTLLDGMGVVATRRADVLSRGEQQRVALARALLHRPRLVLADEPTASLDADTGLAVAELLIDTARASGATLVVVSHDPMVLRRLPNLLTLGKAA